jgi:hypothetical protein
LRSGSTRQRLNLPVNGGRKSLLLIKPSLSKTCRVLTIER